MNYLSLHDYRRAIELALAMSQPGRLLSLFKDVRSLERSSITGHTSVDEVIRTLAGSDLAKLLRYVRDWNANAKTSAIAQTVLFAVVKLRTAEDVMNAFADETNEATMFTVDGEASKVGGGTALKELVEAIIPYTERHLSRMEKLVQESYVVDYLLSEMDDGMFDGDLEVDAHMAVDVEA